MSEQKTTCNRENGSQSDLWNRRCWVADSALGLIQAHLETLAENYGEKLGFSADPDSPFWQMAKDLDYYCEELRVKNGLRDPGVLNREPTFPAELPI